MNVPPTLGLGEKAGSPRDFVTHYPRFAANAAHGKVAPEPCERILEAWFGKPVVLLSSGRAGLHLLLSLRNLKRHRDCIRVPRFLSRCVLNALTHCAFPVQDDRLPVAMSLAYHPFGFPLKVIPAGEVIEDLAHAFFVTPRSGRRRWRGRAAIFSLPKFFGIAGTAGGVAGDAEIIDDVRKRVRNQPPAAENTRCWMRNVISANATLPPDTDAPERLWLRAAYELLPLVPAVDAEDLAGMPTTMEEIQAIGRRRNERVAALRRLLNDKNTLLDEAGEEIVPFAYPHFGRCSVAALEQANRQLAEQSIFAGVYHMNVNLDAVHPEYRPCLLLPCHQDVTDAQLEMMARTVTNCRNRM